LTWIRATVSTTLADSGTGCTFVDRGSLFEETALPSTRPSSGPCSLRVSVSPRRWFRPSRSHDPHGLCPPWGFPLRCR
jgi:hypothetical protein